MDKLFRYCGDFLDNRWIRNHINKMLEYNIGKYKLIER